MKNSNGIRVQSAVFCFSCDNSPKGSRAAKFSRQMSLERSDEAIPSRAGIASLKSARNDGCPDLKQAGLKLNPVALCGEDKGDA